MMGRKLRLSTHWKNEELPVSIRTVPVKVLLTPFGKHAVSRLEGCGLRILAATFDGASPNRQLIYESTVQLKQST